MKKLLIIGLDCATPQLLFKEYRDNLPNISYLMDNGIYGKMKSTIPPITVPAWTSMVTGRDPGELGFYGFRNRKSYGYEDLYFANAKYVKEKTLWNYMSLNRKRSIVIGVPQTYPPKPLNGILVSSFLTPDKNSQYTFPKNVSEKLDKVADGDYIIDVKNFRTDNKDWLLEQIYTMTERRFEVVKHFLKEEKWDFFMFVEMGIDRIHHAFWRYCDRTHRLYEEGNKYENAIFDYYRFVDKKIGEVLEILDDSTSVLVVSDHGAKGMKGGVCINDWLIEKGYLKLNRKVNGIEKLKPDMIDWENTKVWGEGGYYGRIFFNVEGREPKGVIPQDKYGDFRDKFIEELKNIKDENGNNMGTVVYKPEEVYRECKNIPPDLIVYFGNLDYRSAGTVGHDDILIFENDTGPDDANHAQEGIFIFRDCEKNYGGKDVYNSIFNITPFVIDYYNINVNRDFIGKNFLEDN